MARVSTEDIARRVGVSRATVSYVLNGREDRRIGGETRRRVLDAAESLGYVPHGAAIALASGRSRVVLLRDRVSLPTDDGEVLPLGSSSGLMRDAVAVVVRSWGMTLVTSAADAPLVDVLAHVSPSLVIAPSGLTDADRTALARLDIPWVTGFEPDGRPSRLASDLARAQVAALSSQGHTRVAYVDAVATVVESIATERRDGFAAACRAEGIGCTEVLRLPRPDEEAVERVAAKLADWRASGVTAVVAFNDLYAAVVLRAAAQQGIAVPADIAVMGVDDEPLAAYLSPPLTTVRLEIAQFGTRLAHQGAHILNGTPLPDVPQSLATVVFRDTL